MAELENELEDSIDEIEDTTTEDDDIELTVDDYRREKDWRVRAEEKWIKPTKALMKELWVKSLDELKVKLNNTISNSLTETDLEIRDFVKDNPDYKDYKKEISEALAKGYTLKQAKALIDNDDKTIENRKKLNSMNITNWEDWNSIKTYSNDTLAKLNRWEYAKAMADIESGKAKFIS